MDLLLVSTCGTSLLTNGADPDLRGWLNQVANQPELERADADRLQAHVEARRQQLLMANDGERRRLSAELNGVGAVLDRWPSSHVQHLLVHTDTAVGKAAGEVVAAVLRKQGHEVQFLTAPGLRTDDLPSFREALAEITGRIEEWVPGYSNKGWTAIFNLTGGFKSVNAYLQALGMLYADRCVFLFEGAPALMEIPRLPVQLVDADEVRAHLSVFRRLALGYHVEELDAVGVPDALLLMDDGQVTTSVWGDVVWQRVKKTLLGEGLLDPLSEKLTISDGVRRTFDKLAADRQVLVNTALDELSAHLDNVRPLLKARTLKKLQGDPVPPATHELYLWSDGAAWRLFGHYEKDTGRFVADSLGPHL